MRQRKIKVSRFGEKLNWCFLNLVPQSVRPPTAGEHSAPKASGEVTNFSGLYKRMQNDAGDTWFPARERWLEDVRLDRCSREILALIVGVYPELTVDTLLESDFDTFCTTSKHLVESRDTLIDLGRHFLSHRQDLAAFSKQYYGAEDAEPDWPLLALPGWRFRKPILVSEETRIDHFHPETAHLISPMLPGLNARYSQIRKMLSPGSRQPFNGECYRLIDVNVSGDDQPIFSYGPCKYFDYYDSCEIHALQMAALSRDERDIFNVAPFDLIGRAAVPGINTLTVMLNFKSPGYSPGNWFLLHRRSGATVQAGNTIHVVPSGQHQPSHAYYGLDKDVSIWRTMVREFCEEIYSVQEAHGLSAAAGDPLDSAQFRTIVDPIYRSGASRAYLMGVGLDPVTSKPEILLVNIIDFNKIPIEHRQRLQVLIPNWEGKFQLCELKKQQIETQLKIDRANDLKWLPAGKACLTQFLTHFDDLMN
jgi:hypothetical protein